jgi:hypothetical protein
MDMKTHARTLPPRRGQIKSKIFKDFAVRIGSMVAVFGGKNTGTGGSLGSNSTTPSAISSGYNTDASSDS